MAGDCKVQNNVGFYEGVELEDGVFCGPSCVFTNVNNPRAEIERKNEFAKTVVKRGASIGANARSFAAMISANTASLRPARWLLAIASLRAHGRRTRAPHRMGQPRGRKLGADLICPDNGERYKETSDGRLELISS